MVSIRQEIFNYMDDHPKFLPEKVKKAFPLYNPKTVEQYIKQWRKDKYKNNSKSNITSNKDLIILPKDYTKLTPNVLEALIITALKKDQSANMLRVAVDYYTKMKAAEGEDMTDLDLAKLESIGDALTNH